MISKQLLISLPLRVLMHTFTFSLSTLLLASCLFIISTTACGSEDQSENQSANSPQNSNQASGPIKVDEELNAFCKATFTEEFRIEDSFGDYLFTAKVGDEFLIRDLDSSFSDTLEARLYYLTTGAPFDFDVPANDEGLFPFESECNEENSESHILVFNDLTIYETQELTSVLCELPKGTHARGGNQIVLVSSTSLTSSDPVIYEVGLMSLSEQCNDADIGYLESTPITTFGIEDYASPLTKALYPKE